MNKLVKAAMKARENAYAPYSRFKVGAALEAANGKIYTGCNVENCAYGPSVCAERVAIFKAVSEGEKKFKAIATVTSAKEPSSSCGVCLQVMSEFCPDLKIYMANTAGKVVATTLSKLLPRPFKLG